jgi:hypothetical protein
MKQLDLALETVAVCLLAIVCIFIAAGVIGLAYRFLFWVMGV